MLYSARLAASYVFGMQREKFETDQRTQDAVTYRLGVVGEAARWVSDATTTALPVDWIGVRGMRNRLFHGYRHLNVDIIWTTAVDDLPPLIETLEKYLG